MKQHCVSEKEKMLAGLPYYPSDPALTADRSRAKALCFEFTHIHPDAAEKRNALLRSLLNTKAAFSINEPFYCDYGYNIYLGENFYANHGCTILDGARVVFGDNCLLGPGVTITTAGHPFDSVTRASGEEFAHEIIIGNDVWLGANVTVCPGVRIGNNVVVGAGSVVVKDLPDNSVCVGVPAKAIRSLA